MISKQNPWKSITLKSKRVACSVWVSTTAYGLVESRSRGIRNANQVSESKLRMYWKVWFFFPGLFSNFVKDLFSNLWITVSTAFLLKRKHLPVCLEKSARRETKKVQVRLFHPELSRRSWKSSQGFVQISSLFSEASAPHIGIDILKHEYNGAFNTENFSCKSPKECLT